MAEQARFSLSRTIHTFQNPWTRRHAPEAPDAPNEWRGAGAVNPHRISVSSIDAGGTSHILNAAARSANRPHGAGFHGGGGGGAVSPIAGEHGAGGNQGGGPGKHRKPKQKKNELPSRPYGMTAESIPQHEEIGYTERPAINPATTEGSALLGGVQRQAIGGQRRALGVGSFPSVSGHAPEWEGTAQPKTMPAGQYRSPTGGPRVIRGEVERVGDAIVMPQHTPSAGGSAPEWGASAQKATPPRYERGMRAYSPTSGGTPQHRRTARPGPAESPAAPAELPAPAKATRKRTSPAAKQQTEASTSIQQTSAGKPKARRAQPPPPAPPTPRQTKSRAAKVPTTAPPASAPDNASAAEFSVTPAVEAPQIPAIDAPQRARPTAKHTVGSQPRAPQTRVFGPQMTAQMQDQIRNKHAREAQAARQAAAPQYASPEGGHYRRKRAEETSINFQNNQAENANRMRGGYQLPSSPDEAAARRAAARKKLGIPDDVA